MYNKLVYDFENGGKRDFFLMILLCIVGVLGNIILFISLNNIEIYLLKAFVWVVLFIVNTIVIFLFLALLRTYILSKFTDEN